MTGFLALTFHTPCQLGVELIKKVKHKHLLVTQQQIGEFSVNRGRNDTKTRRATIYNRSRITINRCHMV